MGYLLIVASILVSAGVFIIVGLALMFDGFLGSEKQFEGASDSNLYIAILPYFAGVIICFLLGRKLKDDNQKLD